VATDGHGQADTKALYDALRRVAPAVCPSCGGNDWLDDADLPVAIPMPAARTPAGGTNPGIDAIVTICGACGFMRIHSVQALRRFL